ncbi:MAG: response regulator [Capsulimonas sp.]|uniref:response regulator n=1 Tax=Capsulimonas sp. TaxID=2494211 RepID=UPI003267D23B
MADDSEDDRFLAREALRESRVLNDLHEVEDGEALMNYLKGHGEYSDPASAPRPGFILLDLNMPRKTGREALEEIKADSSLRRIPVVILTTSEDEIDVIQSYDLGVSSFITKPVSFEALVEVMKTIGRYWIEIVSLPSSDSD